MTKQRLIIDYVKDGKVIKDVALADNFVFRAYEIFRGKNFIKDEYLKNIIKVILTEGRELDQLQNGIEYNGLKYVQLITSPSMQKKEESTAGDEQDYKIEYLFINSEEKEFVSILEMILSGNKIKSLEEEKKEICLVKDIIARMGLATSGTTKIDYMPNIVIVEEGTYTYKNNYTILENSEFKEVDNFERKHVLNDGGGLMSDHMADIIAKQMNINYRVDFAVIRQYKGIAVKGLVLRFDFVEYMKNAYEKDTDYFRCKNGIYEIKDIFGCWRDIEKADLILNESMVKWLKNWNVKKEEEWEEVINREYTKDKYKPYLDILNNLYVNKVNHDPKKLKTHTQINYQVLQNCCCTGDDLIDMAQDTINYYKRLTNIAKENIDVIRIAMGDIANESGDTTITNKMDFLLKKMDTEALTLRTVKRYISNTIIKKIKQLAGGKMYLKGGYKLGALDPISYCNWLMSRDKGDNGLREHEFYVAGETGNRVFYRNPIALYQEIKQIELANKLDKWLMEYTPELIFFNGFDDTLFQASTADLDGDGFGVIDCPTLYDCVIKEDYPFINKDDGGSVEHKFTRVQLFKDVIASSGNIIGSIAVSNSKLCAEVTSLVDNIIVDHKDVYTYNQLRKLYFNHKGYKVESEKNKEQMKIWDVEFEGKFKGLKMNEEKDVLELEDVENTEQRHFLKQLFYKHKEEFFYILYASQLAIDMPKSLTPIPEKVVKKIEKYKYLKKPVFMHYLDKCRCKDSGNDNLEDCKDIIRNISNGKEMMIKKYSNVMDVLCKHIDDVLLKDNSKQVNGQENSLKLIKLMDYNCESGNVNDELKNIYENHKLERNKLLCERKKKGSDINECDIKLDWLDKTTLDAIESLNVSNEDAVATLKDIKDVAVRFIMTFLWNVIKTKIEEMNKADLVTYKEDSNGEIDWLFKKYSKLENPNLIAERDEMKKLKSDLLKKTRQGDKIRIGGYEEAEITGEVYVSNKHLYRVADNTDIGYIYEYEKKNLANGQVLKIIHHDVAKNGKSVTIIYENM